MQLSVCVWVYVTECASVYTHTCLYNVTIYMYVCGRVSVCMSTVCVACVCVCVYVLRVCVCVCVYML